MKKKTDPLLTLPRHLSPLMRKWAASICDRYQIEPQHFRILVAACEAHDRGEGARKVLAKKGTSYLDRFGAPRLRPEVSVERDARIAFVRCLRELSLENESPDTPAPRTRPTVLEKLKRER